jgi:hypothetical protein
MNKSCQLSVLDQLRNRYYEPTPVSYQPRARLLLTPR